MSGNGRSQVNIAAETGIARSTVGNSMKPQEILPVRRPKNLERICRQIVTKVQADRRLSAPAIKKELEATHGIAIAAQTVRNAIQEAGLRGRTARKKPFTSPKNIKARLAKASRVLQEPQWGPMYADETKINLRCSDGRVFVWRRV